MFFKKLNLLKYQHSVYTEQLSFVAGYRKHTLSSEFVFRELLMYRKRGVSSDTVSFYHQNSWEGIKSGKHTTMLLMVSISSAWGRDGGELQFAFSTSPGS